MSQTTVSARRRSAALLSVGALTITGLMAVAIPADAVITQGGGTRPDNVPAYFQDGIGLRVAPCETLARCGDVAFDPLDGVYFDAEANTSSFRAVWGVGAGFDPAEPPLEVGNGFRFTAQAVPNGRYTIQDPWGTRTCNAIGGRVDCRSAVSARPVTTFLRNLARPAGFLGNGVTPRLVTGSPSGFNRLVIDGPPAFGTQRTSLFTVLGQMPAATPMADIDKDALTMGNRNKTTPTTRILRYASLGTANASATATVAGRNAARFTVNDAACASATPGSTCGIRVTYRPQRNRNAAARLRIVTAGNAGATRVVTLRGTGFVRR
jgi:hypothetical protein